MIKTTISFTFCAFVLFISSISISSAGDAFIIDTYKSLMGLNLDKVPAVHKKKMKITKTADHDPESYKKAVSYMIDKNNGFLINLKNGNTLDHINFWEEKYQTQSGVKIGDELCKVSKLYINSKMHISTEEGVYMYLVTEDGSLEFRFNIPRQIMSKYGFSGHPKPEEACSEQVDAIKLKQANK